MAPRSPKPEGVDARPRFRKRGASSQADIEKEFIPFIKGCKENTVFKDTNCDDTTAAIISTSILDHLMRLALLLKLRKHPSDVEMRELFGFSGPLGTFADKVTLCSMVAIASQEVKAELKVLGEIRNRFAHSPTHLTFKSPEIASLCKKLKRNSEVNPNIRGEEKRQFLGSVLSVFVALIATSLLTFAELQLYQEGYPKILEFAKEKMEELFKTVAAIRETEVQAQAMLGPSE
jgi:hypothetical protein